SVAPRRSCLPHFSDQVLLDFGKRHTDSLSGSEKMVRTCLARGLTLLRLSEDCEQDVLGLDLPRSRACRLTARKPNDHPSTRREGNCPARAWPRLALQFVGEDLPADAQRFQYASGRRIAQGIQAEHQVFGSNVVTVARPRFGLGSLQQGGGEHRELGWGSAKEGFG